MELTQSMLQYMEQHQQEAYELLLELAQIPAPSNQEEQRVNFCRAWLEKQGAEGVYIDSAQNVIYPIGCEKNQPVVVFMAHSDVVFPDLQSLPLEVRGGRIYCPGIGDDTADVVALLMTAKYIAKHHLQPKNHGVLLVVNSGEEGLGNLRGSKQIVADFGDRIKEFITFDAHDCLGVNKAVGSRRFRIEVDTEGGHSYTAFGNTNAIASLASIINSLYQVHLPEKGKTTYNVGLISGGTSVNTIAQHAEMLYEFRSDEMESLQRMQEHLDDVLDHYRQRGIRVKVTLVGDRPSSGKIDADKQEELMKRASVATAKYYGKEVTYESGSTDCNVPLSVGIPAVCVGCYCGGGSHTREEYVEIDSLLPGLKVALDLIMYHF